MSAAAASKRKTGSDSDDNEGDDRETASILERTAGMQPPSKASPSPRYKKAPDAPKRFKSAFIIFSAEKHKEIKETFAGQGRSEKTTDIAKLVSEAWRELDAEEKEVWEKKARKDKARYEVEKAMYKGPWKIPANKRTPKDPTAPKRPMSAFLAFSNKRRAALKRQHPDATNADLSKMLSKTWKEAPEELRKKYMEEEAGLRAAYKVEMAKWRKKVAEEKKAERKERETMAMQAAEARSNGTALDMSQFAALSNPGAAAAAGLSQQDLTGMSAAALYGNPYAQLGGQLDLGQFAALQGAGQMPQQFLYGAQPLLQAYQGTQNQLLQQLIAGQQYAQAQNQARPGFGLYQQAPIGAAAGGSAGATYGDMAALQQQQNRAAFGLSGLQPAGAQGQFMSGVGGGATGGAFGQADVGADQFGRSGM